ncbi:hypothetical protein KSS93_20400 [Pseudomonas xanthosomatis]|uniref:hypothetical protein n=1 Tax=Pseudomonas xanthosomatis TaxID=2842356 RepID=UPI001C3C3D93|nr:hypothetical protein [Pseudomonas xanthosomatis]QXH45215.1 hypothetical protein KSS93_20400 [Pseudomonas xanthosomatis]
MRLGAAQAPGHGAGAPDDSLDEYAIPHRSTVPWYAHFHYPTMDTAKAEFTAGHLKTAAQRHASGNADVYRAPVSSTSGTHH